MQGIRQMLEADLSVTLSGADYGIPVKLIGPDGLDYSTDINGNPVAGRFVYDHAEVTEDGIATVVHSPVLTLRTSTLKRVPQAAEAWEIKAPMSVTNAALTSFILDPGRPPEDGKSMGIRRFYLILPTQAAS